jgi:5'-3' exonuclease
MNMVHRARSGFAHGDHYLTFTFLRIFKKTASDFQADKIYFVKEGRPIQRREDFSGYKSSRPSMSNDFWGQVSEIENAISMMPVTVIRHPHEEADDVVSYLVTERHKNDECVIVSSDSDFIQLLEIDNQRITLWNPVKKMWVQPTEYDYIRWKALVGDASDEIPGIRGVGGKTAIKLLENADKLKAKLSVNDNREIFNRNIDLIKFHQIDTQLLEENSNDFCESSLKEYLTNLGFASIVNDKSWKKFIQPFV